MELQREASGLAAIKKAKALASSGNYIETGTLLAHHTESEFLNHVLQLLTEQGSSGFAEGTRVARLFPNEASLLRLVTALLAETSEEWES